MIFNNPGFETAVERYEFGDKRLNTRLKLMMDRFCWTAEKLSEMFSDRHQLKAYYRFVNNPKVKAQDLISICTEQIRPKVEDHPVILAIQDTTELDYTTKRASGQLGCMEYEHRKGFYLHNHILVSPQERLLGLFSQRFFNRTKESLGKGKERKYLPIEQKESYRWLEEFNSLQDAFRQNIQQQIIQICDREADISELLCARKYSHIHYIIRSKNTRKTAGSKQSIWKEVEQEPSSFQTQVQVVDEHGHKRIATMSVRYRQVILNAPYRKDKNLPEQPIWLVQSREDNPPQGHKRISWLLLTSIPVEDEKTAYQIILYYILRWLIERFHYVLKQGRKVEALQIQTEQALKNAIVLQSWIALQVCTMAYECKKDDAAPLDSCGFEAEDYHILYNYMSQKHGNIKKTGSPTIGDFARLIARMGGSGLQKNRPLGVVSLWRGMEKFIVIKEAYRVFTQRTYG